MQVKRMLIAEYDYDTDIAVQRAEAGRIAFAQGITQGSRQKAFETAKIMLTMGYPLGDICKIAGLSPAEVETLKK